jgi:alpha-galactosidase
MSGEVDADDFKLGPISLSEVSAINQDQLLERAKKAASDDSVLAKKLSDGSVAVGVFNFGDSAATLTARFEAVGDTVRVDTLHDGARVRSAWEQRDLGLFEKSIEVALQAHGGTVLRIAGL